MTVRRFLLPVRGQYDQSGIKALLRARTDAYRVPITAHSLMLSSPLRRCIYIRNLFPRAFLVRFVFARDQQTGSLVAVPELQQSVQEGKGLYVFASPRIVTAAAAENGFVKAAQAPCVVPHNINQRIELSLRHTALLSLAAALSSDTPTAAAASAAVTTERWSGGRRWTDPQDIRERMQSRGSEAGRDNEDDDQTLELVVVQDRSLLSSLPTAASPPTPPAAPATSPAPPPLPSAVPVFVLPPLTPTLRQLPGGEDLATRLALPASGMLALGRSAQAARLHVDLWRWSRFQDVPAA